MTDTGGRASWSGIAPMGEMRSTEADAPTWPARPTYPELFALRDPAVARAALAAVGGTHLHDGRTTAWLVLQRGLLGAAALLWVSWFEVEFGEPWWVVAAVVLAALAGLPPWWGRRLGSDFARWRYIPSTSATVATFLLAAAIDRFVIDGDWFLRTLFALL
ncbi:MAG: hypothetical protein ACRCZP_02285, partial [Phycicoccus sp.]